MTLHEKLVDLGIRLRDTGQNDDAAIVFSAVCQLAPLPKPKVETVKEVTPGFYYHLRVYE